MLAGAIKYYQAQQCITHSVLIDSFVLFYINNIISKSNMQNILSVPYLRNQFDLVLAIEQNINQFTYKNDFNFCCSTTVCMYLENYNYCREQKRSIK